jgi:hypothetical protein
MPRAILHKLLLTGAQTPFAENSREFRLLLG